ncbi:MAG: ATP-dependent sacrificial sulfur transferase LarE [bacterium]
MYRKKKILDDYYFKDNCENRCYYCKRLIAQELVKVKERYKFHWIIEGTNQDDLKVLRPGLRAIQEFGIRSPFLEAALNKEDIRILAKELGLEVWNKPSQGCLATRIPYHSKITRDKLDQIEQGELVLNKMGFYPVRLRHNGDKTTIELSKTQTDTLTENLEAQIRFKIKKLGFSQVFFNKEITCRE